MNWFHNWAKANLKFQKPKSFLTWKRWLDSIQINLQIRWNHPLNSTKRVIVHQKCVKSICNYDSLKSVTLQDELK